MVRLQRVTFMALHNYLGLSYELINPVSMPTFSAVLEIEQFTLGGTWGSRHMSSNEPDLTF